jgi:hypothetical protein
MSNRKIIWLGLLGILTVLVPTIALACAVCYVGPDDRLAYGYYVGGLFLVAVPYMLFGTIAGWLFLHYRAAQGRRVWATIRQWLCLPWVQPMLKACGVQHLL